MGKWAFFTQIFSNRRKSAILGQKTPKKCHFQKMPPNFSAHFWFSKPGFCPLFLGFFQENCPYKSQKIFKSGLLPKFTTQNRAEFYSFSKLVRTLFLISKPDRSSYRRAQSDPRSQNRLTHTSKTMYAAVYEIFHLLLVRGSSKLCKVNVS